MIEVLPHLDTVTYMDIEQLRPHPENPRGPVSADSVQDLAASIKEQGILQPLVITDDGVVIAGHRRLEAARVAGLHQVPVIVRELTMRQQMEIMLVENLQRADLSPIQEARTYQRLREMGLSNAQIATRTGVKVSHVSFRLQLLHLDERIQEWIHTGALSIAHGQHLCRVTDPDIQRKLAMVAMRRRMSADRFDALIESEMSDVAKPKVRGGSKPAALRYKPGSLTRKAAIEQLTVSAATKFSGNQIAEAMRGACEGDCGMSNKTTICGECPVLLMVIRLVSRG